MGWTYLRDIEPADVHDARWRDGYDAGFAAARARVAELEAEVERLRARESALEIELERVLLLDLPLDAAPTPKD